VPNLASEAGFSEEEVALITDETFEYVLKFKLLELFQHNM